MKHVNTLKKTVETFVQITTLNCDNCGKETCDHAEILIGGSFKGGWYHLTRTPRGTWFAELQRPNAWDFCGLKCLKEWVDKQELT